MDTLARLIDRRAPVPPHATCADLAVRFAAEPDATILAVVEEDRPIGLVTRDMLLGNETSNVSIRLIMETMPLTASVETSASDFRDQALNSRPAALARGFIAVENGRYAGVGTAVSLLAARKGKARAARDATIGFGRLVTEELVRGLSGIADLSARLARQPMNADAQACARSIGETGEDLSRLLQNATTLYAADVQALTVERTPRRLAELMEVVEERWKGRASSVGVALFVTYEGDPDCTAEVDGERLIQTFDALIARALCETRQGAVEASLRARPAGDGCLTLQGRVRDSGRELRPDELARIFDFAQAETAELSARVGMALASRVVDAMAGVIRAEANTGAGVTVAFDLMVAEAQAAEEVRPHRAAPAAHILIVDDNATNRIVAEALCEMFDCTSEQALDGLEALEAMRTRRFDLVLMDIKMPRMDGIAATRAIRALPGPAALTPVIALTANADPEDVRGYLAAGMNDVVEKPIKPERLLAVLNATLPEQDAETVAA